MQTGTGEKRQEIRLQGIAVSPGVARGTLAVINKQDIRIPNREISENQIPEEVNRLESALLKTRQQIQQIKEHLSASIGEKDASIFDAHLLVLEDLTFIEAVKKQLELKKRNVEHVYHHLITTYARSMREIDDPYLQERASDLTDVGRRVLNNLLGRKVIDLYKLDQPSIILSHDLSPSDTALLDRTLVLGFATDIGSATSHSAIMARSLQIPAVVGLRDASAGFQTGTQVILDGYTGLLIINPNENTLAEYGKIGEQRHRIEEKLQRLRGTQGVTQDKHLLTLSANVELPEDLPLLKASGAEGIGLYRTEFMFLNRVQFPTEDEQIEVYRKVMKASAPHSTIVRTIDLGGDKLPSREEDISPEANPFLGWRAIRYCLARKDIFRTQLRAICRAGYGLNIRVMFPMIAAKEELLQARQILDDVLKDLKKEKVKHAEKIEVGSMIEIPSAAIIADQLIDYVDFFSIGTNDLIGYTLAVDRTNEKVAYLFQPTHPAIIRLIKNVVEVAHAKNKWVGVCGETSGDVRLTPLLVGLGVDELSMGSIFLPRVKKAIQSLNFQECQDLIPELCKLSTAEEIADRLNAIAEQAYPELLF